MFWVALFATAASGLIVRRAPETMGFDEWKLWFVENPIHEPNARLLEMRKSKEFTRVNRKRIFKDNLRDIETHNARADQGEETWRMGVNEYTDLRWDEFKEVVGLNNGCTFNRTRAENPYVPGSSAREASSGVDWRTKGVVTDVKNQESCGSCWAFSTTGSTEGAVAIETGDLVSLSEQQLVDCSKAEGNKGCEGGLMDYGFKYIIKNDGIDTETDYPYKAKDETCDRTKANKHVSKIKSFQDVHADNEADLAKAVTQQPVSVAIQANQKAFQSYRSGVFSAACGTQLDHGVLAVGYTDGAWIVKNSWGKTWGMAGYIEMKRGVGTKGICGIAMQPSFPIAGDAPPSPGPTPGPAGAYEDPFKGPCATGEVNATISGVEGSMCLPTCSLTKKCPAAPKGFNAQAECVIEDEGTKQKYCGLVCTGAFLGCDRRLEATCKKVSGGGICTYNA